MVSELFSRPMKSANCWWTPVVCWLTFAFSHHQSCANCSPEVSSRIHESDEPAPVTAVSFFSFCGWSQCYSLFVSANACVSPASPIHASVTALSCYSWCGWSQSYSLFSSGDSREHSLRGEQIHTQNNPCSHVPMSCVANKYVKMFAFILGHI